VVGGDGEKIMSRFELKDVRIVGADGEARNYEIIVDRSTLKKVLLHQPDDYVTIGDGFIRCFGKRFIGTFGHSQPVYAGSDGDTYYSPMSLFDGDWSHCGPTSRGNYSYVTADSGTGKLFSELERFCEENDVPALS
jgi:hypothetical protein